MSIKIKGNFKKIIYSKNNFHVVAFKLFPQQNDEREQLLIGRKNYINVIISNDDVDMTLDYEISVKIKINENSKYRESYFVDSYSVIIPDEKEGLIKYLSSSIFKGISKKTATKLVEELSLTPLKQFEENKTKIIEIIGNKKAQIIFDSINLNDEINEISKIFLSNNLAPILLERIKIISKFKILDYLNNHVYELLEYETFLFLFPEVDKIAKLFDKEYTVEKSNYFLVLSEIYRIEYQGSTINDVDNIYINANKIRKIEKNDFDNIINKLNIDRQIIVHANGKISSMLIFKKEKYICDKLMTFINLDTKFNLNHEKIDYDFADEIQKQAVDLILSKSFSIITGGPGTGKTSLIKIITNNFLNFINIEKITLLAPTGKAATQITFNSSIKARTIHSFLKWNEIFFEINEHKTSDVEVMIIDEFSMINIHLFYALLIACPKLKKLVIIGDVDQLPPIGPGFLLNDFIKSQCFSTIKLEKIYRQNEGSIIAHNALLIRNNQLPNFDNNSCILINIDNIKFNKALLNIFEKLLISEKNILDFQILAPMYDGNYGINTINELVQMYLYKEKQPLCNINGKHYYLNDKIIQLENTEEISNGEIGLIKDAIIENEKIVTIKIDFNGKFISYSLSDFNKYTKLAYAVSIHKFQGSEVNIIILIIAKEHYNLLTKRIFYTGYTRAKEKNILISNESILQKCLLNDKDSDRETNILLLLKNRLF